MAAINVLDQHTAELIAAGEVVERPASVVKELLENAIDAGATQVTVELERGGISLIRITDNGTGIEAEYIATAFVRHATSKIRDESDLERIHTLGFRGEALASIASVARVEVLTRTSEDEYACLYRIEGGQEVGIEASARPQGTTMTVRDLFYNTPARMKFLKKDVSEGTYVSETVIRIALSHPEVSVRFVREGKQQFTTSGSGELRGAAYAVLGREFAKDLLPVAGASGVYRLSGLITPPRACRASRGMQFFYINGRFVKNRTMMAALENAYKGTVMQGKFPGCVLMLDMPPELVDVNVHPAKTEVRFARESDVFDAVYRAVKEALAQPGAGEKLFQFHQEGEPAAQLQGGENVSGEIGAETSGKQNDFTVKAKPPATPEPVRQCAPRTADLLGQVRQALVSPGVLHSRPAPFEENSEPAPRRPAASEAFLDIMVDDVPLPPAAVTVRPEPTVLETPRQAPTEQAVPRQTTLEPEPEYAPLQYVGEVFKTYIIAQRGQELCLIDKHAAHERILYETLAKDYGNVSSQMLLMPVPVNLTAEEKQAVLEQGEMLQSAGIEVEDFGGQTVLVRAVPADVVADDVEGLLVEVAAKLAVGSRDALSEKTEWVLHSIACRAAIKAGDKTGAPHLMRLAEEILAGKVPPFCPHGRPVVLKLTKKELEKQFGRLG